MTYHVTAYLAYIAISIILTVWVAKVLFNNGKVFLNDIFHGNEELSQSVNQLLLVGFYLVNLGYAVFTLRILEDVVNTQALIEVLSIKIGTIILVLAAIHFFNLFVFFKLRSRALNPIESYETKRPQKPSIRGPRYEAPVPRKKS